MIVLPLVVSVKVIVSLYVFGLRLLALLLMEAVTVVVAPAFKVPLVAERVTQACVFEAVQLIEVPPVF